MTTTDIPIVIIHTGYKEYVKVNLEITSKNNKIFLIGDETLKPLDKINNVTFVDINNYRNTNLVTELRKSFINYSSNGATFEWFCFERIFILKLFLEDKNLDRVFHMDSDNILMRDINTYPFKKEIAYCITENTHKMRMSNSVHCGLLNKVFCKEFTKLYEDIFITKKKFNLIADKVNYHKNKVTDRFENGGICDMTFYYILQNENIIDVQNLLIPTDGVVFINNINYAEGAQSKNQYNMVNNLIEVKSFNKKNYVYDKINNCAYEIFNIHFQGGAKKYMNENLKYLICIG